MGIRRNFCGAVTVDSAYCAYGGCVRRSLNSEAGKNCEWHIIII